MPKPNLDAHDAQTGKTAKPRRANSETDVVAEKPYVMEVEQAQDQQLDGDTGTEREPFRSPTG